MKTILETLEGGTQWLEKKGIQDARKNMQLLICHQLDISKIHLYTHFDQEISEADLIPLREKLKLRGEGTPLQHLLGTVEFYRREYKTDARALIPRPETEELVEIAIELIQPKLTSSNQADLDQAEPLSEDASEPQKKAKFAILDMGCGSGVIGLTLAAELGIRVEVTCADISQDALSLSMENAQLHGMNHVKFLTTNLFSNVSSKFDLVIANLPYVPETDRSSLAPELSHDPDLALYSGEDGLDLLKSFIQQVTSHLNDQGIIALEIGIHQAEEIEHLLAQAGFSDITTKQDLSGIYRFPIATFHHQTS